MHTRICSRIETDWTQTFPPDRKDLPIFICQDRSILLFSGRPKSNEYERRKLEKKYIGLLYIWHSTWSTSFNIDGRKKEKEMGTCCAERPASAEGRVDRQRVNAARKEVADCQVNNEDVGWRPQPLEPKSKVRKKSSWMTSSLFETERNRKPSRPRRYYKLFVE